MTTTSSISKSTDEYLDWSANRGNNDWIFYQDLARVGFFIRSLLRNRLTKEESSFATCFPSLIFKDFTDFTLFDNLFYQAQSMY